VQSLDELFAVFGGFGGGDHPGALGFRHVEQARGLVKVSVVEYCEQIVED